jgi:hypothetical protein
MMKDALVMNWLASFMMILYSKFSPGACGGWIKALELRMSDQLFYQLCYHL